MPSTPSSNRYLNRNLQSCHLDGMIMLVRCNGCRREARYLPGDLIEVIGDPYHEAHVAPPWRCSRCGTGEWLTMRGVYYSAEERAAGITVRRPVERLARWRWREEQV